jgi:hypothetical protein
MLGRAVHLVSIAICTVLAGCTPALQADGPSDRFTAIAEVNSRTVQFRDYPQAGQTYLSFSKAHGFQVNYLADGSTAYLWYPGNNTALRGAYKRDVVAGQQALCWRYGPGTYNPATKQTGGAFACQSLNFSRKTVVAKLRGDPFKLATGLVPYRLQRCQAPDTFTFDRARFAC